MALTQVQGGMLAGSTNTTTTIQSNGTTAITIDSSQNVGVGTSPDTRLAVFGPVNSNGDATRNTLILSSNSASAGTGGGISFGGYITGTSSLINDFASIQGFKENGTAGDYAGALRFTTRINGNAPTERMRIASDGIVSINTTAKGGSTPGQVYLYYNAQAVWGMFINNTFNNSGAYAIGFGSGGNLVGRIETTPSATSYVTSSDYRLKENIAPMTGALAKVSQLKPVTYTWKIDGTPSQGFIAHELQAVVPEAVNGEKDAVNEDSSIKPQGVDTSFLVATLTAAIQELNAKVDAQAAEIAALKAAK